jgi:hypothetical protein
VHGGRIQFTRSAGGLIAGQINGAIKNSDVQNSVVPTLAKALTKQVQSGFGMMSTNQQLLDIFDTGGTDSTPPSGCLNSDGTPSCKNSAPGAAAFGQCAQKADHIISTCEVATNSLIKNVLTPDVQMFQNGVYAPSAANTMKDSLSVGVGFTAVPANC